MKRGGAPGAADAPKRKKRRGRRKSKAERLARQDAEDASPTDLQTLLSGSSSREWDAAQSLALRIGSIEARAAVVARILELHQAPKAAAHYAKRLGLQGRALLDVVASIPTLTPLVTAQFLVELEEQSLSTTERLRRFVWPWLLQSTEQKEDRAALKAAAQLLLHPTSSEDTANPKMQDKNERGRRLQRALVTQCLQSGKLLHLVATHARAFRSQMGGEQSAVLTEEQGEELDDEEGWEKEKQRRIEVGDRAQKILRLLWPDARVLLFGSSATGLLPSSSEEGSEPADVDLCALLPSAAQFRQETAPLVTELREHLEIYLLPGSKGVSESDVTAVTRARIPIVHYQDPPTCLPCDLCVNNIPALWNTQLLRWLLYGGRIASSAEQRQLKHARHLCKWLRKWRHAKKRVAGSALSSYGLMLLALYYLQRVSVLPVVDCSTYGVEEESTLRSLTCDKMDEQLEALDKRFVCAEEHIKCAQDWRSLRRGFFWYYSCEFDYDNTVVSLRTTEDVSKASKGWAQQSSTRLSVEDPVEIERDLGSLCSKRALGRLRCAFAHACVVLSDTEDEVDPKSMIECSSKRSKDSIEDKLLATWAYETEGQQDGQDEDKKCK